MLVIAEDLCDFKAIANAKDVIKTSLDHPKAKQIYIMKRRHGWKRDRRTGQGRRGQERTGGEMRGHGRTGQCRGKKIRSMEEGTERQREQE